MARPFDLEARQLRGEAFPLAERVTTEQSRYVGASVSENGTLVYGQAGADVARQLTWFDRTGRELGTLSDASSILRPRAVAGRTPRGGDVGNRSSE